MQFTDHQIQSFLFNTDVFTEPCNDSIEMWGQTYSKIDAFSNYCGLLANVNLTLVTGNRLVRDGKKNRKEYRAWIRDSKMFRIFKPLHMRFEDGKQKRTYFYVDVAWQQIIRPFLEKHGKTEFLSTKKTGGIYDKSLVEMGLCKEWKDYCSHFGKSVYTEFRDVLFDLGLQQQTLNASFNADLFRLTEDSKNPEKLDRGFSHETKKVIAQLEHFSVRLPKDQRKFAAILDQKICELCGLSKVPSHLLEKTRMAVDSVSANGQELKALHDIGDLHCEHFGDKAFFGNLGVDPNVPENGYFTSRKVNVTVPRWNSDGGIRKCEYLVNNEIFTKQEIIDKCITLMEFWKNQACDEVLQRVINHFSKKAEIIKIHEQVNVDYADLLM